MKTIELRIDLYHRQVTSSFQVQIINCHIVYTRSPGVPFGRSTCLYYIYLEYKLQHFEQGATSIKKYQISRFSNKSARNTVLSYEMFPDINSGSFHMGNAIMAYVYHFSQIYNPVYKAMNITNGAI